MDAQDAAVDKAPRLNRRDLRSCLRDFALQTKIASIQTRGRIDSGIFRVHFGGEFLRGLDGGGHFRRDLAAAACGLEPW